MKNNITNLVCSYYYSKLLKKIDGYKVDLGKTYTKKNEIKRELEVNIKDNFVKDFLNKHNKLIYKVGVLGYVSIYTYSDLNEDDVIIVNNNEYKYKKINIDDAEENIEKSFAELIMASE